MKWSKNCFSDAGREDVKVVGAGVFMLEVAESAVAGLLPKIEEEPIILREEEPRNFVTGVKGLKENVDSAGFF